MRRFLVDLAAFAALLLAIPLALETGLRLFDVRTDVPTLQPAETADGPPRVRLAWNPQVQKPHPPQAHRDFPVAKPPGAFRIFVVGESETAGVPYGTEYAFSSWLEQRLRAQAPGVRWEVVNVALGGLQSWSALSIVRDVARYQPDLLIVYLGHNETGTRFSANERRWLDPRGFASRAWLLDSRLYATLSRLLPARAANQLVDVRTVQRMGDVRAAEGGRHVHATPADRALSAAMYRARLAEMVRVMHTAGARTMLLTLSQNYADWAPAASSHRPGMRPDEKAAWRTAVREGDALAPHDCAGALAAYARALAIDDGYAELQFKVASCERTLGQLDQARARFRLANDLDRLPQGAPTTFNDILREVADRNDAILVDTDLAFYRASGPRLVGDDFFIEAVHLNLRGHQLIARIVADAIREAGLAGRDVRWNVDAYVDPDPDAIVANNPDFQFKEHLARVYACTAAGRADCTPK